MPLCSNIPRSCLFFELVKVLDPSVSIAVVPPRAMSQAVAMANMYENAAVASASGDIRPTMRIETVCKLFWSMYASITGTEAFTSKSVSENHGELDDFFGLVGFWIKGVSSSGKDSKVEGETFEDGGC